MRDAGTIVWKELSEWLTGAGRRSRVSLVIFTAVFGVVLPLQWGAGWMSSVVSLASWGWLPFLLVSGTIADAVAGERERHTLETLLASRLSDGAVFYGKLAASVIYAVGQLWLVALTAAVTTNVAHWTGSVSFYPPVILAGLLVFPILVACLAAGIGMLVSLRAPSARAAQQSLTVAVFVVMAPLFVLGFLPESVHETIDRFVAGVDLRLVPVVLAVVLASVDAALIGAARARFVRGRIAVC